MTESTEASPERWTVIQVAAYLTLTYHVARNNMLAGDYGPADYNPATRTLTVLADNVRSAKSKRGRKPARRGRRASS